MYDVIPSVFSYTIVIIFLVLINIFFINVFIGALAKLFQPVAIFKKLVDFINNIIIRFRK